MMNKRLGTIHLITLPDGGSQTTWLFNQLRPTECTKLSHKALVRRKTQTNKHQIRLLAVGLICKAICAKKKRENDLDRFMKEWTRALQTSCTAKQDVSEWIIYHLVTFPVSYFLYPTSLPIYTTQLHLERAQKNHICLICSHRSQEGSVLLTHLPESCPLSSLYPLTYLQIFPPCAMLTVPNCCWLVQLRTGSSDCES